MLYVALYLYQIMHHQVASNAIVFRYIFVGLYNHFVLHSS